MEICGMSRIQPTEVYDGPQPSAAPSSNILTNHMQNSDPDATEGGCPNTNIPNNQERSQQEQINLLPDFRVAPNMDSFSLQALQNMLALFFHYYKNGKYQNVVELNTSSSQQMNMTQQIQPTISSLTVEQVHSLEKWINERKPLIEEVCEQIKQGKMVTEAIPTTLDKKEVITSPHLAANIALQQPATDTEDEPPAPVPEPVASQTVADQVHNIEEPTIICSGRTERLLENSGISEDRPAYSLARRTVEGDASGLQKQDPTMRKRAAKASNVVHSSPPEIAKPNDQENPSHEGTSGYFRKCIIL
ncbi:unnamed protein product [Caenorhabditis brenneri]